jgi:hypothetical protein
MPPQAILVFDWWISKNLLPWNCLANWTETYLAKQFQRRRFLEINQPETRIAYGSHVC